MKRTFKLAAFACAASLLLAAVSVSALGQGRGQGSGRPAGPPSQAGPPAGVGVDRGIGTSGARSDGRADTGRGTASGRSEGRSDAGLGTARENSARRPETVTNTELARYRGIARRLDTTTEALHADFLAAQAVDPNLKFGQFVAAHMIGHNLGSTHPGITSTAILSGLQNGDSIGQTLQNLGLSEAEAKRVQKESKRQIKASRANR